MRVVVRCDALSKVTESIWTRPTTHHQQNPSLGQSRHSRHSLLLRRVHANLFFAHVPLQTQPNPEGRGVGSCLHDAHVFCIRNVAGIFPISSNQLASIILTTIICQDHSRRH
jgi:hypothetical protein